jgi:hypothetical protein
MESTAERAATYPYLAEDAEQLRDAAHRIGQTTMRLWGTGDPEVALANATAYLEAFGHVVVAWLWLEQLLVAGDQPGSPYEGKRSAGRYFFRYELPRTTAQWDLLDSLDRTVLDVDTDHF